MDNELEQDMKIDPNQLDVEAVTQADTFFKWAEKSIQAREEVDLAELKMKLCWATLEAACRLEPEKFNLTKITEGAIKAAITASPIYIDACTLHIETRKISGIMDKAVMAMEQKKRMLEILVTLHGQQYFAGPSVPRDLGASYTEAIAKRSERVNEKQKSVVRKRKTKVP